MTSLTRVEEQGQLAHGERVARLQVAHGGGYVSDPGGGQMNAPAQAWMKRAGEGEPMIVITIGQQAARVAQQLLTERSAWFTNNAPLWWMDVPLVEEPGRVLPKVRLRLSAICGEVARLMVPIAATARHGGLQTGPVGNGQPQPAAGAPPAVWFLLDMHTVDNLNVYRTQVLGQAQQTLRLLDAVAWQQWRTELTPQVILLTAPGDQRGAADCRRQLSGMIREPIYQIGYRVQTGDEQAEGQQRAQAVAALLWLPVPAAKGVAGAVREAVWQIGAVQWRGEAACLQRGLAIRAAQNLVRQLLQGECAEGRPAENQTGGAAAAQVEVATGRRAHPAIAPLLDQLLRAGEQVAQQIPAPTPHRLGRGLARGWRRAQQPVAMLQAHYRGQVRTQHQAQRQARQAWLAQGLTRWEAVWQPYVATMYELQTAGAWTNGAGRGATIGLGQLQLAREQILARFAQLDRWLGELANAVAASEARVAAVQGELERYCTTLPEPSLYGLWQAGKTPRRWASWLWQLNVGLPRRLRQLERVLNAHEAAIYHDANGHVVRQLGLALLQDVQQQWVVTNKLRKALEAADGYLAAAKGEGPAALPWPWDEERLRALGEQWARHVALTTGPGEALGLARLLDDEAAGAWAEGQRDTTAEGQGALLGERLVTWCADRYAVPATWTSVDWLEATFGGNKAHFGEWLARLRSQASAPGTGPIGGEDQPETWLILPRLERADDESSPMVDDCAAVVARRWLLPMHNDVRVVEGDVEGIWVVVWQEVK